ncbi:MAG TPA: ribosome-binding factor A [Candidatus Paceibacterota bacterium]|nr:ribosome-binding factor A [Candidatus Paceibacterota bacterium]
MSRRKDQVAETIAHHAADFFARESNRESLITVTHADLSPDLKNVIVYFSVMPEKMEEPALNFAKRVRTDFREYLKAKMPIGHIPTIDFSLDLGEKNRQKIDEALRKAH